VKQSIGPALIALLVNLKGGKMKVRTPIVMAVMLLSALPLCAGGKNKKVEDRAMLEKMEAVPCGANQKGLSGLGSFWASVGVTDVHTNEKMCPQYLLRADQMDYRIRPEDLKHPVVLPVGQEVVFKIKKDKMYVKVPEGGDGKVRAYQVVAIVPATAPSAESSAVRPATP
jgi:hypothetical protein